MPKRVYMLNKRNTLKLTQRAIAEQIGISYQHYGFIENGTRGIRISLGVAGRIAAVLGIPLNDFFTLEEEFQKHLDSSNEENNQSEDQKI